MFRSSSRFSMSYAQVLPEVGPEAVQGRSALEPGKALEAAPAGPVRGAAARRRRRCRCMFGSPVGVPRRVPLPHPGRRARDTRTHGVAPARAPRGSRGGGAARAGGGHPSAADLDARAKYTDCVEPSRRRCVATGDDGHVRVILSIPPQLCCMIHKVL